jgi:glucokinase
VLADQKGDSAQSAITDELTVLGDIGGTTARFAVLDAGKLGVIDHMNVADYPCFADVLKEFLDQRLARLSPRRALFAVAGPVERERCALVNNRWVVDAKELHDAFDFSDVHLVNDFEATAWSLPQLTAADLRAIGGGEAVSNAPMVVIGPGTGLGVAGFVAHADRPWVIATEGGHGTLPSSSHREDAVVRIFRERFGHVSAERALSGAGIENLYHALANLDGRPSPHRTAAEITQAALEGGCATSRAALDMFCAMLGTVAANMALSFGARGGVYIAGGIVPRITDFLTQSSFRERFEAKGRLHSYMKSIPSYVIVHPDVAFLGLQTLAQRRRRNPS